MSGAVLARKAAAEVFFAGVDITASIRPYLLSLTYTDSEEDESDSLQIKIQDRDGRWLAWLDGAVDKAGEEADATDDATDDAGTEKKSTTPYTVTAKIGLRYRSGPGTSFQKLGTMPFGTLVEVYAIENKWARIHYGGVDAYAYADWLEEAGAVANPETGETSKTYIVSNKSGAKYHKGPGATYKTIGTIPKGEEVPVYSQENGWAKIKYNGEDAYVALSYLTLKASKKKQYALQIQAAIVQENWNGTGEKLLECGQFELASISAAGPPGTVTIKGVSLPYSASIRETKHTQTWEFCTLSAIAKEIADKNGLALMYETAQDISYERMEQFEESDIVFLSELCHSAGLSLKTSNNILILFDQETYEQKPPLSEIKRGDGSYISYTLNVGTIDTEYQSCRVSYVDPATGLCIEGIAYVEDYQEDTEGQNNKQLELTMKVSSIGQAQKLAEKQLRLSNKYAKTASFTLPGNPDMMAGVTMNLSDFGLWSGKYLIKQAEHSLGSSGYTTKISLRRVLEG